MRFRKDNRYKSIYIYIYTRYKLFVYYAIAKLLDLNLIFIFIYF